MEKINYENLAKSLSFLLFDLQNSGVIDGELSITFPKGIDMGELISTQSDLTVAQLVSLIIQDDMGRKSNV